jgi:hypothetical protein
MKKFTRFTFLILGIVLLSLVLLDIIYTTVYMKSSHRGKIDYVYNSKARYYDVAVLGSSRANNHFVTQLFEEKELKSFNYGISGGHLFEASLLLKLMVERKYTIKNLIIETDLNLSNEHRSDAVAAKFLPYIHHSKTIQKHFSEEEDFLELYYIPFYRYLKFDASIGFREMYNNLSNEPTNTLEKGGFYALGNKKGNMKNDITALKPIHNKYYEEIKRICEANNIRLIAVMTPMCTDVKGLDYFQKVNAIYPEIYNYENVIQGNQYFSSCGHMNEKGARLFTTRIIKDFF